MSIVVYLAIGLVAALVAHKIGPASDAQVWTDFVVGSAGALIGGFALDSLDGRVITGVCIWNVAMAIIGAIALLVPLHIVRDLRRVYW